MNFNEKQLEIISHDTGASQVIASAGSGKSTVLLERTKHLATNLGIPQNKILVISFTNNTATELSEKLKKKGLPSVKVGTFHAIAREILAKNGDDRVNNSVPEWEIKKSFEKYLEEPLNDIVDILSFISLQKTSFKKSTDKDLLYLENHRAYENFTHEQLAGMFVVYENLLKEKNAYDFDDWLIHAYEVCKANMGMYTWDYVMVDESQDSNEIQHKLKNIWCKTDNVMVVGDYRQCFTSNTKVSTIEGLKEISKLTSKDKIMVATGRGRYTYVEPTEILKKEYKGIVRKITTTRGKTFTATPNHVVFAKQYIENNFFIYLMYREGYGFRIGQSSPHTSKRDNRKNEYRNGYKKRLTDEKGDKLWLIKVCNTQLEATFFENYYAFEYGIPLYIFEEKGRKVTLKQEDIKNLFNSIDTYSRGIKLLNDMNMDFNQPHEIPYSGSRTSRVNFVMFGGEYSKTFDWNKHALNFCCQEEEDYKTAKEITKTNKQLRKNGKGNEYYECTKVLVDQDVIMDMRNEISEKLPNVIQRNRAMITSDNLKMDFTLVSNLHVGMSLASLNSDTDLIEQDVIVDIEDIEYNGEVYDINVDNYRNYCVNEISVHNCMYAFNGAKPKHFMEFYKQFANTKVINMNINYRSCDNIVKYADKFVKPYYSSFKYNEDTIANNKNNGYISYRKYAEKTQEAVDVVDEIEMLIKNEVPLNQIAVLYRNNAHADFVECELRSRKIPYAVSGNGSFFKRKFISGIIAIMRLLENEDNDQAFEDLFRFKPDPLTYFSKKDLMDIKKLASKDGISYLEGFNKIKFAEAWKNTNKRKFFMKFRSLDDHYVSLESMINTIVSVFNIENQIRNDYENKEDVQEHLDSIDTLKKFAKGTSLEGFLKFVDGANNTKQKQTKDGVRLMTVHASKGLEFQCCFLISVEEGKFPNPRADITEEANIFYVGVTRAKQYLQISSIGDSDFIEPYTRNISSKDFLGTRKREVISRIVEEEGKKEVKTAKKQGDLFDF